MIVATWMIARGGFDDHSVLFVSRFAVLSIVAAHGDRDTFSDLHLHFFCVDGRSPAAHLVVRSLHHSKAFPFMWAIRSHLHSQAANRTFIQSRNFDQIYTAILPQGIRRPPIPDIKYRRVLHLLL
jgi:hypothetical protein